MEQPAYDIAVIGAGPVGSALALLLANKATDPSRIAVFGHDFRDAEAPTTHTAGPDPRALAMNHGSRQLLEQLDAWPTESADIRCVHVSQRGRLGRTVITNESLHVPRLGSVVGYDTLLARLHAALHRSGATLIQAGPKPEWMAGAVEFALGERQVRSRLAIQSSGMRPSGIRREYGQVAVLASLRASRPADGWAYERFTRQGPLALLPHPHGQDLYSLVWCCPPARADDLLELSDEAFADAVHLAFGDRLGRLTCVGNRHRFPLSLHAGPSMINPRTIAVGNAAQTLHPVAGQGLNLGLRDAGQLAVALTPWLAQADADPRPYLDKFVGRRRPDRWLTAGITDFLPRVFTTGNPAIEHAAGLTLLAMDLGPPLQGPLARHLLIGLRG